MIYKIMSFNLLTNHLYDIGRNRFTARAISILKLIQQEKPDLIGVQELTPLAEKKLQKLTELYGMTGEYRLGTKQLFNESNAIFYCKERFNLLNGSTYWLSKTPDKPGSSFLTSIFPRIAALGEHRNEHQLATAQKMKELGYVYVANNAEELKKLLIQPGLKPLHKLGNFASQSLIDELCKIIG